MERASRREKEGSKGLPSVMMEEVEMEKEDAASLHLF
jgi:hypothetical protein